MTQRELSSRASLPVIRDSDARRVCHASGITGAQNKLVSLRELRDGLNLALRELEAQRRKEEIAAKALLVARFTKATCDAFLEMVATVSKLALPDAAGKKVQAVEGLYGTATPWAEALGTHIAGGKVDYVKTGVSSAKKAASLATLNKDAAAKVLAKSTVVKAEIIVNAMNSDTKGLVKSAASYTLDLHAIAFKEAGLKRLAGIAELTKVAQSAFTYNEQIGKAVNETLAVSSESEERYQALRATIVRQARVLSARIAALERVIDCAPPRTEHRLTNSLRP
jgi:hypothetical protein